MTFSPLKFVTVNTLVGSTFATNGAEPLGVARNLSQLDKSWPLNSGFHSDLGRV